MFFLRIIAQRRTCTAAAATTAAGFSLLSGLPDTSYRQEQHTCYNQKNHHCR